MKIAFHNKAAFPRTLPCFTELKTYVRIIALQYEEFRVLLQDKHKTLPKNLTANHLRISHQQSDMWIPA